jgi:hypothetical protein
MDCEDEDMEENDPLKAPLIEDWKKDNQPKH